MSALSFLPTAIQASAAVASTALNDIPLLFDTQAQTNPTTWTIAPTKTGESAIIVTNNVNAMPTTDAAAAAVANFINSNNSSSGIIFGTASSIDLENQSLLVDSTFAVATGASATATGLSVSSGKSNHSSTLTSETAFSNSSVTGANSSGAPAGAVRMHYSVLAVSALAILATLC